MNKDLMFSSKTDMWETPHDFFDKVDDEFHFTLDVCATPENAKCEKFYTEQDDGLSKPWTGVVWCNPPYGKGISRWILAANAARAAGNTVVMLLPARTDTRWFHDLVLGKAEIRFVRGRLKFGGSNNSAPFPSMVAVFRNGVPSVFSVRR